MISFSKLGEYGRFGNQLFQYAYIRTQAQRLKVKFYCPSWLGETIFTLGDEKERCESFVPSHLYKEDPYKHGFSLSATSIEDGIDVAGYFQSWKFFTKEDIFSWYVFKESLFTALHEKYSHIDFSNAVAVHVRLGDYMEGSFMFYTPTATYFKKALSKINSKGQVVVFSEHVETVKKYLGSMPDNTVYIEGNKNYEDFYLMTLCKDTIISPSSFSWWAAYLNKHPHKKIIAPTYWYIPYSRVTYDNIHMPDWITLDGHRVLADNYYYRYITHFLKKKMS